MLQKNLKEPFASNPAKSRVACPCLKWLSVRMGGGAGRWDTQDTKPEHKNYYSVSQTFSLPLACRHAIWMADDAGERQRRTSNPWTAKSEKQEWQRHPTLNLPTPKGGWGASVRRRVHRKGAGSQHLTRWESEALRRTSGPVYPLNCTSVDPQFCRKEITKARNMYSICFISFYIIHSFFFHKYMLLSITTVSCEAVVLLIYKLYTHTHTPLSSSSSQSTRSKQVTEKQKAKIHIKREVREMWNGSVKDLGSCDMYEPLNGNIGGLMVPQSVLVWSVVPSFS